jgi:hypothetical protein
MTALRSLFFVVALVLAAPGCAAPVQNGGVVMSPHAEARLDLMCRYRAADTSRVCVESTDE